MRRIAAASLIVGLSSCGASEPVGGGAEHVEHAVPSAHADEAAHIEGLAVSIESEGTGRAAALGDEMLLHYDAFVAEHEQAFDSTMSSGVPLQLVLGGARPKVIDGLTQGLVGLRAGARARLEIAPELAWGAKGNEAIGVPADAKLVYHVRIVSIGAPSVK